MSPESLQFSRISKEADVWSYGILLWEIYTYGSTPYPSLPLEHILEKILSGYRMEKPKDCDNKVYESIILKCWNLEPKLRPTFSQLVSTFETFAKNPNYSCVEPIATENFQAATAALLFPPKAQPEELTPFLNPKRNQTKISAQSSSSNWSECSTEQTHTNNSDASNSLYNRSYASSSSQNQEKNLFLENLHDHMNGRDLKKSEFPISKKKITEHPTENFKLVTKINTNVEGDLNNFDLDQKKDLNLFRSFTIEEEDKKPFDSGFKLAKKQFFNFFIRPNSSKNEKSNTLIGKV
jgi:hypothetical protein